MDIPITQSTFLSRRLHHEATSWFYLHPKHPSFIRAYVAGEFTSEQEQKLVQQLGGSLRYVQVTLLKIPISVRAPMTQQAYERLREKPPFFEALQYTDYPIVQTWLFPLKEAKDCEVCHTMSARWMFYSYENIQFAEKLVQNGVESKYLDEHMWTYTMLEQVITGPKHHETHYDCQRCIITMINSLMGNLGATHIIPLLQKEAETQDRISAVFYRKMNNSDIPMLGVVRNVRDVEHLVEILSQPTTKESKIDGYTLFN